MRLRVLDVIVGVQMYGYREENPCKHNYTLLIS